MSTKTTFKRIALVTVAALGFGLLTSVAPSSAAAVAASGDVTGTAATASFGTNASSMTVVDTGAFTTKTAYAVFEVSLTNKSGYANILQATESLTATVIANPNTGVAKPTANAYIDLSWATDAEYNQGTGATTSTATGQTDTINEADNATYAFDLNRTTARGGTGSATNYLKKLQATATDTVTQQGATATYALHVTATSAIAMDAGFYTIRIDLLDTNTNAIQSTNVTVQFVTSKVGAGSVSVGVTGPQPTGGVLLATDTQNITATLTDANGGLVRTKTNGVPTLSGSITDSATVPLVDALTWTDAGTSADAGDSSILDGVYVATMTDAVLSSAVGAATVTAIFGNSSNTGALLVTGTTTQGFNTSVTATGKVYTAGQTADVETNYDLPLTTKSATVKATVYTTSSSIIPVADAVVYYTITYASCVTGDMSPVATTVLQKTTADANGVVSIAIANANPISGCNVTVAFSGGVAYTGAHNSLTRVLTWAKSKAASVVTSPAGNYSAVLASTHKVTWTILDQFSAPVVGSTVQFTATGANAPTAGVPSVITDAAGQVSYTWTDAAGVVASATKGFSAIELKSVGTDAFVQGKRTVTYVTTMPAITSLYSTYTTTVAGVATTGTVPTTTNIGSTTGVLTSSADQVDLTASSYASATKTAAPWVTLNFEARKAAATTGTNGVPTTVTVTGAKLIGSDGKLATSTIVYANENVYVLGTTSGIATVTAVNGTVTSTATINFVNAAADARVLSLSESAGLVTATVKDAFGNAVSDVNVAVVGTGGAWLGNGATSTSFTTSTDGTVTFSVTGTGTISAKLSTIDYLKASKLANSGDNYGLVSTPGSPAGVRSASVATLGRTDAATAAAQDAADAVAAVAALSTQVSEMISALKAQLTALTNLVIKIQKKVKA